MTLHSHQPAHSVCQPVPPTLSRDRLITGLLALVTVVSALVFGSQFQSAYPFQHDFHDGIDSPILATELARSESDLEGVLTPDHARYAKPQPTSDPPKTPAEALAEACARAHASLSVNTYEDFAFIVFYSLFLWRLGCLFAEDNHTARKLLGIVAFLTALSDVMENIGILRVLHTGADTRPWNHLAPYISIPSRTKWTLFGLALLITARILLRSANPMYSIATRRLLPIGYILSAILFWVGALFRDFSDLIALAVSIFSMLVLVNLSALLGPYIARLSPGRIPHYVEDFCQRKKEGKADLAIV